MNMEAQNIKGIDKADMKALIGLIREIMDDIANLTAKQTSLEAQIHYLWLELSGERLDSVGKQ